MNINSKCIITSLFLILLTASCVVSEMPSPTINQALQVSTELSEESDSSLIPSASQTAPSTLIQQDTDDPIAAHAAAKATEEQFFNQTCPPWAWNHHWSPSHVWATMSCFASRGHHGYQLVAISPVDQTRWEVYVDELQIPEGEDDPANQLFPIHWTDDERYLFFSAGFVTDPGFLFSDGVGLFRLDLTSGDVVRIVGGQVVASHGDTQFAFSFSPDDQVLYYVQHHVEPFGIRSLQLFIGDEAFYPLAGTFDRAGRFVWSPTGDSLVFLAATGYGEELKIHVVVMYADSGDIAIVPTALPYTVNWLEWVSDTCLKLEAGGYPETPKVWILDISTGELIPVDGEG